MVCKRSYVGGQRCMEVLGGPTLGAEGVKVVATVLRSPPRPSTQPSTLQTRRQIA